jgi:hypothetical protein
MNAKIVVPVSTPIKRSKLKRLTIFNHSPQSDMKWIALGPWGDNDYMCLDFNGKLTYSNGNDDCYILGHLQLEE